MMAHYSTIVSRTKARPPERGKRIDSFARQRWANWLPMAGVGSLIDPDALAQELASDPTDRQSWPRSRVRRWRNGDVTVSADGAFKAGAALVRLGAPVSAPEALFASGHAPAFLEFLAMLAVEDAGTAASLAILPSAAFVFGSINPIHMEVTGEWQRMGVLAKQALLELRTRAWPHAAFQSAWDRYVRGQTALRGEPTSYAQTGIVTAYDITASPHAPPRHALEFSFPFIVDWVIGLPIEPAALAELMPVAEEIERFVLSRRHGFRRAFLHLIGVEIAQNG
jgi:hypothetical protein